MKKPDLKAIRPYGDHLDDGIMQFSFTLPIPPSDEAREAAKLYLEKLGFTHVQIVSMELVGEEFAFFVAYAQSEATLNFTKISVPKPEFPIIPHDQLLKRVQEKIGRRLVVIGGTTGSDAHTVGIDAILSIKGIKGDKGLEYYPCFQVINLRAQVSNERLVERALELKADALLVSQVVTQQDQHLKNLRELTQLLKKTHGLPPHLLLIAGGPRMDHRTALSVGFHGGFGPGTLPSQVANFIVHELIRRMHGHGKKETSSGRVEEHVPHKAPPKRLSLFGWLSGGGKGS